MSKSRFSEAVAHSMPKIHFRNTLLLVGSLHIVAQKLRNVYVQCENLPFKDVSRVHHLPNGHLKHKLMSDVIVVTKLLLHAFLATLASVSGFYIHSCCYMYQYRTCMHSRIALCRLNLEMKTCVFLLTVTENKIHSNCLRMKYHSIWKEESFGHTQFKIVR